MNRRNHGFIHRSLLLKFIGLVLISVAFLAIFVPVLAADPPVTNPRVEILPTEGPVGTNVFVRVYDYTPRKQMIIIFGQGTTITTGTIIAAKEITDDQGYAITNFAIDLYPAGRYNVIADDGTNKRMASFRVTPKITLSSAGGFVDDVVLVSGDGFAAKKPISVSFDDVKVATIDADSSGKISEAPFAVPSAGKGDHTVKVQDSEGNYVVAVYNVRQKLSISPASATVGSEIDINGTGFQPKDITIYFDDKDVTAIRVDNNGNFAAKFKVPACADGVHKIKVDDGVNRSYCELTVLSTITISPASGSIGTSVGIQGSGFRPGFPITINYDSIQIVATPVDSKGSFTHNFKIPKSRSGPHTVSITDGINNQKITFTVESTPPSAPNPISPPDATRVEKALHLEWSSVSDPSGVSYVLEISRDAKFSEILVSTANLTQCSFGLPEDNKLLPSQKDPYYWRVKAIDGASNEGPWSSISSFHKGYTLDSVITNMPDWTKYILIAFGMILVAFLFFWLGRALSKASRVDDSDADVTAEPNADTSWGYGPESTDWTQN